MQGASPGETRVVPSRWVPLPGPLSPRVSTARYVLLNRSQSERLHIKAKNDMEDAVLRRLSRAAPRKSIAQFHMHHETAPEEMDEASEAATEHAHIEKMGGEVTMDSFSLLKVLGRGSFGKVLLAEETKTKELRALKVLKKLEVTDVEAAEACKFEAYCMTLPKAAFIVKCYAAFQTPSSLVYVLEPALGGDFLFHVNRLEQFDEATTAFYAAEICLGLFFLHSQLVIFRDLKLDNILLTLSGHVRLTDFGLSKGLQDSEEKATTMCGKPTLAGLADVPCSLPVCARAGPGVFGRAVVRCVVSSGGWWCPDVLR